MGARLTHTHPAEQQHPSVAHESGIRLPPWLDDEKAALVRAIVATVARQHPALRAVILFGSIARHDERPLTDDEPSDVDLLLLFDFGPDVGRISLEKTLAVCESIGQATDRHRETPREVQTVLAVQDLRDWDPLFVEHVASEGWLLWARGPLPEHLAAVAVRAGRE
jgi:predicted nucleotidyltransferase